MKKPVVAAEFQNRTQAEIAANLLQTHWNKGVQELVSTVDRSAAESEGEASAAQQHR